MAIDIGINFRETSTYVTDGTNETYCLNEAYPTTRGGFTFGLSSNASNGTRDRDNTLDRRLAGICATGGGAPGYLTFRIDLPSIGTYNVHGAFGDADGIQSPIVFSFADSVGTLATVDQASSGGSNRWVDANGTELTQTTWPSSETARSLTIRSTDFYVNIGRADNSAVGEISHVRIVTAGAAGQSASAAGHGSITVTLQRRRNLVFGTAAGKATVTATAARRRQPQQGIIAGAGAVTANLHVRRSLLSAAAGAAAVTVSASARRAATATVAGVAHVTASLTKVAASQSANAQGSSTASAILSARRSLVAAASGASTAQVVAGRIRALLAQANGLAAVSASLGARRSTIASAAGLATASASLSAKRGLTAASTGSSAATASAAKLGVVTANVAGQATVAVTLSRIRAVAPVAVSGSSSVSATLSRRRAVLPAAMAGRATAQATPSTIYGHETVHVGGTSGVSAVLSRVGNLRNITAQADGHSGIVALFSVIELATIRAGKYQTEHDTALADLGAARGFTAEHASALRDIAEAGV